MEIGAKWFSRLGPVWMKSVSHGCLRMGEMSVLLRAWGRNAKRADRAASHDSTSKEAMKRYRRGLDALNIFYTLDTQGNFTYANKHFFDTTGYRASEVLGQNVSLILPNGVDGVLTKDERRLLYAGETWSGPARYKYKDGTSAWVHCWIVPYLKTSTAITGFGVFATDVTKQHNKQAQQDFGAALDLTDDEVYILAPETLEILYVNAAGRKATGLTNADLGERLRIFDVPLVGGPQMSEGGIDTLAKNCKVLVDGSSDELMFEVRHRDGSFQEAKLQLVEPEGMGQVIIVIYRDITKRKLAEKAKTEFVSSVSHELRTPLTSIKGALGLVLNNSLGEIPESAKPLLDIAYNNCDRLTRLINDILDIAKFEAGKMDLKRAPIDLVKLIQASVQSNKTYGDKYGVSYVTEGLDVPVKISGDGHRLMEVMDNLMSNAAKFSKEGDKIIIALSTKDGMARISVKDTGAGIPLEAQATIFDKFAQADSSDTRSTGGTGLGLSIAKLIVEKHGGTIGFVSEPGKGTEFTFELPLLDTEIKPVEAQAQSTPPRGRILVCEDEPDIALILRNMLARQGYEVEVAGTGQKAQEMLADGNFDGMTLDLGLPDKSGLVVLEELLDEASTDTLPIIVVSANDELVEKGLASNLASKVDWMGKPILEPLLEKWLSIVEKRQNGSKRTILHVDSDEDICELVSHLVGDAATIVTAGSLAEARQKLAEKSFDLVILETVLPDGDGGTLLPVIEARLGSTLPVILFSINEGVRGRMVRKVLLKSKTSNQDLEMAVRSTMSRARAIAAE